jgi:hypothetical protein
MPHQKRSVSVVGRRRRRRSRKRSRTQARGQTKKGDKRSEKTKRSAWAEREKCAGGRGQGCHALGVTQMRTKRRRQTERSRT